MRLYGHPDVRILDCSRDTWRAGGCAWSTAASEPPTGGFCLGGEDSRIRADRAAVRQAICEVFAPTVLDSGGELTTYCTIGGRAATAWFVLTHLIGRDRVRVYDGSWAEWDRIPDTPVAGL
jgi:3-mercaptopyruvate sulfurtransferase SseA